MEALKVKIIKSMTIKEFPWLENDLKIDEEFFIFKGPTYGCISKKGIAVSKDLNKNPFFEVPKEFVEFIYRI